MVFVGVIVMRGAVVLAACKSNINMYVNQQARVH